jgi:alpha 1,2-mannosyltransferase
MSEKAFKEFKETHKILLEELPSGSPTTTYNPGSIEILFIGGGRFSWLSYLSLLGLRETGSKLPVEVIMPTYFDYEEEIEFCTEILPKLNASCLVIPEVFGASVMTQWNKKFRSYQFKSLALMASSFQNVLLLDSDNIVIENPDAFFDSDLFKRYGIITWPDYWRRTISPHFYNISGTEVNKRKRVRYDRLPIDYTESDDNLLETEKDSVPFHDLDGTVPNMSTESGQLFISKLSQEKTLLLSLYYNLYGPQLYYKLFSLGELGEGDKDSFAAAATVLKQEFYQLKPLIKGIGYFDKDDHFQGEAMAQKNPLKNYEIFKEKVLNPLAEQK